MVSLSNQARLLAAQAFNKKVLEDKARAKQAEIDAEARAQEQKRFQRQRDLLAKQTAGQSANIVNFQQQRLEDDIRKQQATAKEKARVALIRKQATAEKAQVFSRVAKGADIGVLTGFEAIKNTKGQTIGISNKESATRKNTRALLIREIQQQQQKASRETDLERFLKNERALDAGQVSLAQLNRQIAQRKAKGLSKTPAQKRASQGFRDFGLQTALSARSKTKPRGLTATFGSIVSERGRAEALGSSPFADPLFAGGGRKQSDIIARGGTFGARAGGQSFTAQLNFISQAKSKSTSARIGFANSLLAGLGSGGIFGGGGSQQQLLGIVSQKKLATPKTFEQELSAGVGFFTTIQKPVTKAKITKGQRASLVSARKAEDKAKADSARSKIAETKATTKAKQLANRDELKGISASLFDFNVQRGAEIERQNFERRPRVSRGQAGFVEADSAEGRRLAQQQIADFGLGAGLARGGIGAQGGDQGIDSIFASGQFVGKATTVQRVQAQAPTALSLIGNVPSFQGSVGLPSGVTSKDVGGVERFFKNGKEIKGGALVTLKRNLGGQGFGVGSGTGAFNIIDGVARAGDQSAFIDPRLAQAKLTQAQTKALRESGGTGVGFGGSGGDSILDPARDFGRETLGFGFNDRIVSEQAGLVQATGSAQPDVKVNIFDIPKVPTDRSVEFSESLVVGSNIRGAVSQGNFFEQDFTESLGLTASAKQTTKKKKGQPSQQNPLTSSIINVGQIGSGITSLFAFEAVTPPSQRSGGISPKGTSSKKAPKSSINTGVLGDFINGATGDAFDVDLNDPILQGGIQSGGSLLVSALPKSLQKLFG